MSTAVKVGVPARWELAKKYGEMYRMRCSACGLDRGGINRSNFPNGVYGSTVATIVCGLVRDGLKLVNALVA